MRVLVTGGAGYIGSHTAKALAERGIDTVVLDNLSTGRADAVRWSEFVRGDIGDRDAVRRLFHQHRFDGVIHFAASAYVGESVANPRMYFRNNIAHMLVLLEAMLDAGVNRIIFSSSCATYGSPQELPILETTLQLPVNPYGVSKLTGEYMLRAFGTAYGLQWVALRYFNAAGADPNGDLGENHNPETHLIPLAIDAALGCGPALTVFGNDYPTVDGTPVRDFVHVTDLAVAHLQALEYLIAKGASTALNLGTGVGHSVAEVVAAVERVGGLPVPLVLAARRPGDPPALVAAPSSANRVLGWSPHHSSLDEIVATAWAWRIRPT